MIKKGGMQLRNSPDIPVLHQLLSKAVQKGGVKQYAVWRNSDNLLITLEVVSTLKERKLEWLLYCEKSGRKIVLCQCQGHDILLVYNQVTAAALTATAAASQGEDNSRVIKTREARAQALEALASSLSEPQAQSQLDGEGIATVGGGVMEGASRPEHIATPAEYGATGYSAQNYAQEQAADNGRAQQAPINMPPPAPAAPPAPQISMPSRPATREIEKPSFKEIERRINRELDEKGTVDISSANWDDSSNRAQAKSQSQGQAQNSGQAQNAAQSQSANQGQAPRREEARSGERTDKSERDPRREIERRPNQGQNQNQNQNSNRDPRREIERPPTRDIERPASREIEKPREIERPASREIERPRTQEFAMPAATASNAAPAQSSSAGPASGQSQAPAAPEYPFPVHGNLDEISVIKLFRIYRENGVTGRLRLEGDRASAVIYIAEGMPSLATMGDAQGDQALTEVLLWHEGKFDLTVGPTSKNRNVQTSPDVLLKNHKLLAYLLKELQEYGMTADSTFVRLDASLSKTEFIEIASQEAPIDPELMAALYIVLDGKQTLAQLSQDESVKLNRLDLVQALHHLVSFELIDIYNAPVAPKRPVVVPKKIDGAMIQSVMMSLRREDTGMFIYPAFLYFLEEEYFRVYRARGTMSALVFEMREVVPSDTGPKRRVLPSPAIADAAQRIAKRKRHTDVLGHYEAFDFAILLPGTGSEGAKVFVNKILKGLTEKPLVGMEGKQVSFTFGVACIPEDFTDINMMLSASEIAMQNARDKGKAMMLFKDITTT